MTSANECAEPGIAVPLDHAGPIKVPGGVLVRTEESWTGAQIEADPATAIRYLLEKAGDFPEDAPILIITDGACDVLTERRSHAYLVPAGMSLPFKPHGPVFGFRRGSVPDIPLVCAILMNCLFPALYSHLTDW